MADLSGRDRYEDELAVALMDGWRQASRSATRGLEPNWQQMRTQIERNVEPVLRRANQSAALRLLADETGSRRAPSGFDAYDDQAAALALLLMQTRRETWNPSSPLDWVSSYLSRDRAHSIAVTEITDAVSTGEDAARTVMTDTLGLELIAVWNTEKDARVCPICAPLDGKLESVWKTDFPHGPPAHPNCLLGETPVRSASLVAVFRAKYYGPIVSVRCATGSSFRVTANHMLLTPDGFVMAHLLNEGDQVIDCQPTEMGFSAPALGNPDHQYQPPTIEEIFRSLAESSRVTSGAMPVSSEDFHGDGGSCNGQVDIVRADRLLWRNVQTDLSHPSVQNSLVLAGKTPFPFVGLRSLNEPLDRLRRAADSSVGVSREVFASLRAHAVQSEPTGILPGSHVNASVAELLCDKTATNRQALGDTVKRFSGIVSLDRVVDVEIGSTGHGGTWVYDMETDESLYTIASGIVSSNCRCFKTYRRR